MILTLLNFPKVSTQWKMHWNTKFGWKKKLIELSRGFLLADEQMKKRKHIDRSSGVSLELSQNFSFTPETEKTWFSHFLNCETRRLESLRYEIRH